MTNINRYNTYIQSIFKLLSVNNKPQLIGSAKLKNHRHRTDFDLQEFAKFTNSKVIISSNLNTPLTIVVYHFESSFDRVRALNTSSFGEFICNSSFIGIILNNLWLIISNIKNLQEL